MEYSDISPDPQSIGTRAYLQGDRRCVVHSCQPYSQDPVLVDQKKAATRCRGEGVWQPSGGSWRYPSAVVWLQGKLQAVWLQALAAEAERLLAAQAQQHVNLESALAQLQEMIMDPRRTSVEMAQRVRRLRRVVEVLYTKLAHTQRVVAGCLREAQAVRRMVTSHPAGATGRSPLLHV